MKKCDKPDEPCEFNDNGECTSGSVYGYKGKVEIDVEVMSQRKLTDEQLSEYLKTRQVELQEVVDIYESGDLDQDLEWIKESRAE